MKTISVFNNKGGVGKTTLTFHLAHALAEMGHKTLIVDLDPQCNLSILAMDEEKIHEIWVAEDDFVEDFQRARDSRSQDEFRAVINSPRSIHFLLKPTEDGTDEIPSLCPPNRLATNLDLLPGRLTMHLYEDKIAGRWSDVYQGDPLAIRTVTRIRQLALEYTEQHGYEFVIMDTSPSLGALNRVVISTTDGFLIPCMPDMFSLYGVRNIGNALSAWKKQFKIIYELLSTEKRASFPQHFVRLLGFTIYSAKKYAGQNEWDLAAGHFNYAKQIPHAISRFIAGDIREHLTDEVLASPIGGTAVMHTHNTLPGMAQKYHVPIWNVPSQRLETSDANTVLGNRAAYEGTRASYVAFAGDLLQRITSLD
ncbi:MAG TPA: ParA family protein [Terracidiphilus sp.]|nr:ParA family protein [Terracidiphilus sp.]